MYIISTHYSALPTPKESFINKGALPRKIKQLTQSHSESVDEI